MKGCYLARDGEVNASEGTVAGNVDNSFSRVSDIKRRKRKKKRQD